MIRSLTLGLVGGATLLLHAPLQPGWRPFANGGSWTAGWTVRLVATVTLLALPLLHARLARRLPPRTAALVAVLAATSCGAALAGGEVLVRLSLRWPATLAGSERLIEGTLLSLPRSTGSIGGTGGVRFDLRVDRIACPQERPGCRMPARSPQRLQVLDWSAPGGYAAGQRWRWRMRLQPPDGPLNPGVFDRERWLLGERIDAVAGIRAGSARWLGGGDGEARGWLDRQRERWSIGLAGLPAAVARLEHGDPFVVAALALGRGDLITARWRTRLQDTGTSHLIAISGLHVGLVFGAVQLLATRGPRWWAWFPGPWLWGGWSGRREEGTDDEVGGEAEPSPPEAGRGLASRMHALLHPDLLALCAAAAYAALAGFGLPVQRALLMLGVLVLVRRRARTVAPGTTLALAVVAVLVLDPLAPLSGGFWLSAGAVAVLIGSGIGRSGSGRTGWRDRGWRTLRAQGWLTLVLLPVGAFAFQQVSLVSAPVNLLAIPFVGTVVVPLSLASTALLALGATEAADAVLTVTLVSVAALRHALDAAAAVPGASQVASLPGVTALGLCLLAIAVAGVGSTLRPRAAWWALAPVLVLPGLLWATLGRPVRGIELHVLDVGHGLAALVLTPRATLLFDTGGGRDGATRAQRVVVPYLHGLGRRRIDRLVVSHLDADHAAGLPWLAERFAAMDIIAPDVAAVLERLPTGTHPEAVGSWPSGDGRVTACRAGDGFDIDGVSVGFLHPAGHDAGSRNDRSCVALVSAGAARLLLPGDIEAGAERRLVSRSGALPVDVLVAPHHGSDTSSSAAFVDAFPARDVVFAAARRSRWGFPHAAARMRYRITVARPHTVGETGALVFRFDPERAPGTGDGCCAPRSARWSAPRLWRQP